MPLPKTTEDGQDLFGGFGGFDRKYLYLYFSSRGRVLL
jgi:hypothetical protein